MKKLKQIIDKIAWFLRWVFGYGILITLFAGGLTFFGYVAALCIGGDTAALICDFIYKDFIPIIIKVTTSLILLGLLVMYLSGEQALVASKKKKEK